MLGLMGRPPETIRRTGNSVDERSIVVGDYILIDGVESGFRKNNGKHSNQKKAA
jgi:hypothetical protein